MSNNNPSPYHYVRPEIVSVLNSEELFTSAQQQPTRQLSLFQPYLDHPAVELLKTLKPDEYSPRQALETLYRLKKMAEEG